jgi:CRISPR-associated protein Csd1
MILQALDGYYRRLAAEPEAPVPLYGFNSRNIDFIFVLNLDGELVQTWTRLLDGGIRSLLNVPFPAIAVEREGFRPVPKRANQLAPYFLWDKTAFSLGVENKQNFQKRFDAFKKLHHSIGDNLDHNGMQALLKFLDNWVPQEASNVVKNWNEIDGKNIAFQIDGERCFLHDHEAIKCAWFDFLSKTASSLEMQCLISGKKGPVAGSHPPIRNIFKVEKSQKAELALVSFNDASYCSYGKDDKKRSLNAPISERGAFNYTSALNFLLDKSSRQKVRVGDTTTVFWTEKASAFERFLGLIFDPREDQSDIADLRLFLEALREGRMPAQIKADSALKFYIFGLSPNASRLSVRFWHVSTVEEMVRKVGQHFADLRIIQSRPEDQEFPGVRRLLHTLVTTNTDPKDRDRKVPPVLGGALMRSILTGALYPQSLLAVIVNRIRDDQNVNYLRAALTKACIVRKFRVTNNPMEVTVSLDEKNTTSAYLLGRLFAVIEKAQIDAHHPQKLNSTIKDRYFGSASATPRSVFPMLLRLSQHHIQKAEFGFVSDKRIEEIMCDLKEFPAHLSLEEQGLFAIGYYHQRQALFTKKTEN